MTAGSSATDESTANLSAGTLTSVGFGAPGAGDAVGAGACAGTQAKAAAIKKHRDNQRLNSKMLLFIDR